MVRRKYRNPRYSLLLCVWWRLCWAQLGCSAWMLLQPLCTTCKCRIGDYRQTCTTISLTLVLWFQLITSWRAGGIGFKVLNSHICSNELMNCGAIVCSEQQSTQSAATSSFSDMLADSIYIAWETMRIDWSTFRIRLVWRQITKGTQVSNMDVISTSIFSFSCNHSSTLGNSTRALNIQQDIFDVLVLQVIDPFGLSLLAPQLACVVRRPHRKVIGLVFGARIKMNIPSTVRLSLCFLCSFVSQDGG